MAERTSPASFAVRAPAATLQLAERQRALTETLLRVAEIPESAAPRVEEALRALDALREALAPVALGDALPRLGPEPRTQRPYYLSGVITGAHHPLRPDLEIGHEAGVTRGSVTFGVTFEGPPGCVHGGFVAHFFDQILGQHNLWAGIPAMTASLTVRYRRGTPILRTLGFEVTHEIAPGAASETRKVITRSALVADGTLFSEAEGFFVVPKSAAWAPAPAQKR